ncbi:hypothetical protein Ocin01_09496 [Orchesella cincta]|uniref:Uncharacterized protein n=1 Tax=Orchesella cincta TaxID=48709 RepID=A0A1D2MVZ4_ORCCI|nr:hypothetical protein Ocin01_09496 [Orchesella cincta]
MVHYSTSFYRQCLPTTRENLRIPRRLRFNDRAWNDPPSLLMNSAAANSGAPTGTGRKLNSRVAFPLDSASYPTSDNKARAPLNPNAPPPMGGFVNSSSKPPLP